VLVLSDPLALSQPDPHRGWRALADAGPARRGAASAVAGGACGATASGARPHYLRPPRNRR